MGFIVRNININNEVGFQLQRDWDDEVGQDFRFFILMMMMMMMIMMMMMMMMVVVLVTMTLCSAHSIFHIPNGSDIFSFLTFMCNVLHKHFNALCHYFISNMKNTIVLVLVLVLCKKCVCGCVKR